MATTDYVEYKNGVEVTRATVTVPDDFNNAQALRTKAQNALNANAAFLAIATPTNAQLSAQVQTLTKECSALIRLAIGQLDSTSGT